MIAMSDQHDLDRQWLIDLRVLDTTLVVNMLHFELEHWRQVAIERELDRRDNMARGLLKGES